MTKLTPQMHLELRSLFTRFDLDKDGLLNEKEVQQLLLALGEDVSPEVLSLQFMAIDIDGDGAVQFQEFADWWLDYQ